jgi:hypothetical protein
VLDTNATYWVSNTTTHDQPNQFAGMTDHQGTPFGDPQFNGAIIFDCISPFRLAKAKVYANTAAIRKIDLRNSAGDILQTKSVNIPAGTTIISLDLDVPVGTGLVLTTDETVNQATLGTLGPQLRRSTQDVAYPYEIPNVLSMKNSNFGIERYYYFYNWEVDFYGYECTSERVPVTAVVDPSLSTGAPSWASGLRLFPNPVSGLLNIEIEAFSGGELSITIKNTQGAALYTRHQNAPSGNLTFQNDVSALPKGIYWLELAAENGVFHKKIAVQ